MPADWTVAINVAGDKVVPASARLGVRIERAGTPSATAGPTPLPTRLEDELTERDLETMFVLWVHSVAALGWIIGVVVMAIALSARPGVVAEGLRNRLRAGYASWGAWVHWSLVPAIVLTGIYNMIVVTPFPLVWRPSEIKELVDVPYGALYEAILLVKLGLFGALLITGTQTLARSLRPPAGSAPAENRDVGFLRTLGHALGPAGITYVATVPLIVAAAMSLRYVHILSHVAEVVAA